MIGKKGALEKGYYENLLKENLENEPGFKIFLFHTALSEFKPKELEMIDSAPLDMLPRNFDYYAGGHPHFVFKKEEEGYGVIAYPGPLFPNNFSELERLENGGFYLVEEKDSKLNVEWQPITVHNVFQISLDCNQKSPAEVEEALMAQITDKEFNNTIVAMRLFGTLGSGKVADIDFKKIIGALYERSAHFVMKNTSALSTKELGDVKTAAASVEQIEAALVREAVSKMKAEPAEEQLTKQLMVALDKEKGDEKTADFERRLKEEAANLLGL
jgi:hypothetical protein